MALSPKLVGGLLLVAVALLLVYGAILTLNAPSTTLYFFIFPIATVGPSFVQYASGVVMLLGGIGLALFAVLKVVL